MNWRRNAVTKRLKAAQIDRAKWDARIRQAAHFRELAATEAEMEHALRLHDIAVSGRYGAVMLEELATRALAKLDEQERS